MTPAAKSAVAKRSVVIGGHKTSVSLEEPFWSEVRKIADAQGMTVSALLRRIDHERDNANLSSAIRLFVLQTVREAAEAAIGRRETAGQVLWPVSPSPA